MAKNNNKDNNFFMSNCKICGSSSISVAHRVGKYTYYRCASCQTLFLHPLPKEKKMDFYYESQFEYQAGKVEEERIRIRARKILHSLHNLKPSGKSLLDIGSGYGFFLHEAQKEHYNVMGIEPSKALYQYSKTHSQAHLVNTNLTLFVETSKERYDFITLIHVIEHMHDPASTIKEITSLLKPGGILYIETPNLDSHLYHVEQDGYTFLTPPDHLWIFSQFSMKAMMKTIKGISIAKVSTLTYPEHFMGILKLKLFGKKYLKHLPTQEISSAFRTVPTNQSPIKTIKYLLFDKLLAPLMSPLLDLNNKGSVLELYITKK